MKSNQENFKKQNYYYSYFPSWVLKKTLHYVCGMAL